jgi:uncharacterized protein (DUF427 family)
MKTPDSSHPITITPEAGRVTVRAGGQVIAASNAALVLREASYPPVFYIPRADAHMELLERTARSTHCPYKGDASYFSIPAAGGPGANAVWSYEAPYPAVAQIAGHLAFYADRVEIAVAPL